MSPPARAVRPPLALRVLRSRWPGQRPFHGRYHKLNEVSVACESVVAMLASRSRATRHVGHLHRCLTLVSGPLSCAAVGLSVPTAVPNRAEVCPTESHSGPLAWLYGARSTCKSTTSNPQVAGSNPAGGATKSLQSMVRPVAAAVTSFDSVPNWSRATGSRWDQFPSVAP